MEKLNFFKDDNEDLKFALCKSPDVIKLGTSIRTFRNGALYEKISKAVLCFSSVTSWLVYYLSYWPPLFSPLSL